MFCYNCGKQIPDGAKFCRYCGAAQNVRQEPPAHKSEPAPSPEPVDTHVSQGPSAQPKPAPKSGKGPLGIVIAAVVVLAAFVLGRYVLAPGMMGGLSQTRGSSSGAGGDSSASYDGTILNIYGTVPAPQSDTLGDSWDSYTIEINGKVLTFPCTLDDFKQTGFTIRNDLSENDMVDARGVFPTYYTLNQISQIEVTFVNGYDEPKPVKECLVAGVQVSYGDSFSVVLPGGIVIGEDTPEELERIYGAPVRMEDTSDYPPHQQAGILWEDYMWYIDPDNQKDHFVYTFNVTDDHMQYFGIYRGIYEGQGMDESSGAGESSGYLNRETNDEYFQALAIIGYQSPTSDAKMLEGLENPTLESFVRNNGGDGLTECFDYVAEGDTLVRYYETLLLDLTTMTAERKEQIVGDLEKRLPELEKLDFVAAEYRENADGTLGILTFACTDLDKEENRRVLCDMGVFSEDGSWSVSEIKEEITSFGYISKYK